MFLNKIKLSFHKLTHWEYWPFGVVYFPIYFVWLYYSIKSRAVFFGTAANPLMENGGFLMESKKKIYDVLPSGTYPETLLFHSGISVEEVKHEMLVANINYPIIAKPDIGMKGLATQKIEDDLALTSYISKIKVDFLIQKYINYPNEVGIFYIRYPGSNKGIISGIVAKEFLIVCGDGIHTIENLISSNPRYLFQLPSLIKIYGILLQKILAKGELLNLMPYGNHARGSKFIDATNRVNDKLQKTINELCLKVPELYFGRLDIKFESFEDLENGVNFSIIELNGAGSEPTHIYDPTHSVFFAWKEISRHLKMLYEISSLNREKGATCMSTADGIKMLLANKAQVQKLLSFSN